MECGQVNRTVDILDEIIGAGCPNLYEVKNVHSSTDPPTIRYKEISLYFDFANQY